jgi:23S rRNA pseudouridine955/2504/2580 synthase
MKQSNKVFVSAEEAGQKLYQFLVRKLGGKVPGSALMRWIRTGQVRVDSARSGPYDRLEAGQEVRLPPQANAHLCHPAPPPYSGPVPELVYEDDDLLVLNKPPGIPVHPGTGHSVSVHDWIAVERAGSPFLPTPAHRIDRDTSGLLVFAKSYASLRHLQELWKSGGVSKLYLAWACGAWDTRGWVRLRDRLGKSSVGGRELVIESEEGKEAVLLASAVGRNEGSTLVAVRLLTGRTHQIRIQLALRGHPLVGDRKYGGAACPGTMLLHCWHLSWEDRSFTVEPWWSGPFAVPAGLDPSMLLAAGAPLLLG